LPWTQTSERISRNFWRIWTRKTSVNTFRNFWLRIKSEYWGVKKSHEGEKRIFRWNCLESRNYYYYYFLGNTYTLIWKYLHKNQWKQVTRLDLYVTPIINFYFTFKFTDVTCSY
jgi:hypothetical protein